MDTVKINKGKTQMIAHRGLSALELENTCAAFVAAGNRSYFGIETDVHVTADGRFIIIHDDSTSRVSDADLSVEDTAFETLRGLHLKEKDGSCRRDLVMPSLEEYLWVCRRYEKEAVLELKNPMERQKVHEIVDICEKEYGLEHLTFISFDFQNLKYVKETAPKAKAQFLAEEALSREQILAMKENEISLDIYSKVLTKEMIDEFHAMGMVVNCWTVNDPEEAKMLAAWGGDQITTNILE